MFRRLRIYLRHRFFPNRDCMLWSGHEGYSVPMEFWNMEPKNHSEFYGKNVTCYRLTVTNIVILYRIKS